MPTSAQATPPRRSAFSLIELLVAISIIVILASMTVPAVASIRESARRLSCSSGLRQVGLGCLAYAGEWRGYFPPQNPNPNFWSRPGNFGGQGLGLILEYLGDGGCGVLFCSSSRSPANSLYTMSKAKIDSGDWLNCYHYGYTYHAGVVDVDPANDPNVVWAADPKGFTTPLSLGNMTATFKANNRSLFMTQKILSVSGRAPLSSAIIAADAVYKFQCAPGFWMNTGVNHPSGGPLIPGKGGGNVVHGDGHIEWYVFPRDMINDSWLSNALWKAEYVSQ